MSRPFYQKSKGLRFECTDCGNCCTRPGPVYFGAGDLRRAAGFLGMSPVAFRRRYGLRPERGVFALDPGDESPCTFHDGEAGRCRIYEGRPAQCRTWPFWPEVVGRRRSWNRAARECEGMNRGRLHAAEEIERHLELCDEAGLPEGEPW